MPPTADNRSALPSRFANRPAQIALAVFAGILGILGVAGLIAENGSLIAGIGFIAAAGLILSRALQSATVIVSDRVVIARSVFRRRRFDLSELRRAELAVGKVGINGFDREYLVLKRLDGGEFAFKELNARLVKPPNCDSVVRRATRCINGLIANGSKLTPVAVSRWTANRSLDGDLPNDVHAVAVIPSGFLVRRCTVSHSRCLGEWRSTMTRRAFGSIDKLPCCAPVGIPLAGALLR